MEDQGYAIRKLVPRERDAGDTELSRLSVEVGERVVPVAKIGLHDSESVGAARMGLLSRSPACPPGTGGPAPATG